MGAFVASLPRLTLFLIDIFLSVIIPVWDKPLLTSSEEANKRLLQVMITKTLMRNLSFGLEPRTRLELHAVLSQFLTKGENSYAETKLQLENLISQRHPIAKALIPSYGLSQLLASLGFFSISQLLLDRRKSRFFSAKRLAVYLSVWGRRSHEFRSIILRGHPRVCNRQRFEGLSTLIIDGQSLNREPIPFDPETLRRRCLIIGPGEFSKLPTERYDTVLVLVTLNTSGESLADLIETFEDAHLVLNNDIASLLVKGDPKVELLRESAVRSKTVVSAPQWLTGLERTLKVKAKSYHSPLLDLWDFGAPNLFPRAISYALQECEVVDAVGVDLYTGKRIYSQTAGQGNKAASSGSAEFLTCVALAGHDAEWSFRIMKSLYQQGIIVGGMELARILAMEPAEYMLVLNESVGSKRL